MLNIRELAAIAQEKAQRLGIEKFDLSGSTVDESNVQVDQGKPKQVKASNRSSITVRVWNADQQVGIASTTDVDPLGLETALQTAHEASFFGITEHAPDFSPEALVSLPESSEEPVPQAPIADLLNRLVSAERKLIDAHPAIVGVPYNGLSQRDIERFYVHSQGATRYENRSYSSIYLYSKTEQPDKKPRSAGAVRISRQLEALDVQGCIQEAIDKTVSHLDYRSIATGKYTVVFSPEAFLSLLGAFSNLFNAQSILDKQSLSTPDSLGTSIASPLLSVSDDILHPANISQSLFDGEGTPTRRVTLIENGVLKQFLHSAGTAKRMNAQPTGHANMGSKITVSPHFYHVEQGTAPSQTYNLADADNVVLIDDLQALHAGVKSLQGSFSLPFDGWLISKGERISIDSATVAGDFRDVLKSILYVEPESHCIPSGVCPYIWVEGLSITGQ
ncbi:MAG TPA: TldD/PmbA family protein [Stenomitos sp.]